MLTLVIIATGGVTVGTVDGLESVVTEVGVTDGPVEVTEVGVTDGPVEGGVLVIMILGFKVVGRLVGDLDGVKLGSGEGMLVGARLQSPHVIGQSSRVVEVVAGDSSLVVLLKHLAMLTLPTQSHDFFCEKSLST
jgi:hypothetical protein